MSKGSLVFDVKRYAINDGPGIRITIFLKGCPLSCTWCHNPESIKPTIEKLFTLNKCIRCRECVQACPTNACAFDITEGIITDKEVCKLCGKCAEVCPTKATEMSGEVLLVDEIMQIIKKETLLMDQSDGGVTFSGGEPLMHHELLVSLLKECGKEDIHRCIDTTGFTSEKILLEVAQHCEHFLYDLKMMDDEKHKLYTSVSNKKILYNLKLLAKQNVRINIRIPLIKDVNDDDENIHKTAQFIKTLENTPAIINILPYHNIAQKKYEKLGSIERFVKLQEPEAIRQQEVLDIFKSYDLHAIIGG